MAYFLGSTVLACSMAIDYFKQVFQMNSTTTIGDITGNGNKIGCYNSVHKTTNTSKFFMTSTKVGNITGDRNKVFSYNKITIDSTQISNDSKTPQ